MSEPNPILARTTRSGIVESLHRGRLAVTSPDGEDEFVFGDVGTMTYPRSATKLFQTIAMLESGYDLDGKMLALAAASHSSEEIHLKGVREILASAGLSETDLCNTPDLPFDDEVRVQWIAAGRGPESIAQDCSGKHAAMLVTCVRAGWTTNDYLDRDHPLQQAITTVVSRYTGEKPDIGIDGCGAPAHTMSTRALARSFGRIAAAGSGNEYVLAEAFRAFPEYVSGTRRWESRLHRAVPGLICKIGAEASFAIGLPNGQGIAMRIDDGAYRALPALAVAALSLVGIRSDELAEIGTVPILGWGRPVGQVESLLADLIG